MFFFYNYIYFSIDFLLIFLLDFFFGFFFVSLGCFFLFYVLCVNNYRGLTLYGSISYECMSYVYRARVAYFYNRLLMYN